MTTVVDGGAGNDSIEVAPYVGKILGGDGNDTIDYSEENIDWHLASSIDAGAGNDVVEADIEIGADNEAVTIALGAGKDSLSLDLDMDDLGMSTNPDEQPIAHYRGGKHRRYRHRFRSRSGGAGH